jgi:hypothetical protein
MDELSAHARLADAGVESPLVVSVSRTGIEQALEQDGADLILDLVRENGDRQERRVTLALDQEALTRLAAQDTDPIAIALDPESLAVAFDDVEAHGLREAGAALAVLVVTAGGGAGMAQAYPADGTTPAGGAHATTAAISPHDGTGLAGEHVQATVVEAGMPRAMPSDYAASEDSGATLRRDPGAAPTGAATTQAAERGIENVRASQPPPATAPDPTSGIESVRVGGTAVPDPSTGIENVRADRSPAQVGDDGTTIAAPSTGAAVAIAGGALLMIAAAAFAIRRTREPRPA